MRPPALYKGAYLNHTNRDYTLGIQEESSRTAFDLDRLELMFIQH